MKRNRFLLILCLLTALVMATPCLSFAAPMTSAEKEAEYSAAIEELEAYLEAGDGTAAPDLEGIADVFRRLGRYEQSQWLLYYTQVLLKLTQESYDYELTMYLEAMDLNDGFKAYLSESLKGSAIGGVDSLRLYAESRQAEHEGRKDDAMAGYGKCLSFYDANSRYMAMRQARDGDMYDRAAELLSGGDLAGAYHAYKKANGYADSDTRMAAIESMLGYVPADENDNPEQALEPRVEAGADRLLISWDRPRHADSFEVTLYDIENGQTRGPVRQEGTTVQFDGLEPGKTYQYVITAICGKVRMYSWQFEASTLLPPSPTPKPTASPTPLDNRPLPTIPLVRPGDIVTFGRYEQDNKGGAEPIEWLVLDYDAANDRALLLSRYGLDVKRYNNNLANDTWEKCHLRTWLNNDFMTKAFSFAEKKAILTTEVDNSRKQGYWGTNGGNNTQDRVFLLSYAEANKYLDVTYDNSSNTKSRVAPTAYAVKQGAFTNSDYKTADGEAAGWWWLRSPGYARERVSCVNSSGSLSYEHVITDSAVVRPALWVNLESGIF